MAESNKSATLTIDGASYELPMFSPTAGPDVVDIRKLYAQAGVFTYDPGFTSTASCDSTITFIDGDKGELLHRGYPIDQLASKSHYLEVCYVLLYGELPSPAELEDFESRVTNHTMIHEQMINFFRGFRRDAHPMAVMVGVVGAMSAFYHDSTDITDEWQREVASIRLIAKMPTIAAMAYKYTIGQPFVYPRNDLDYASNFLRMCFAVPAEDYVVDPILSRAMDRIFTLHADHEQNASTSTVRLASSSGANPFACIAAGIACLWGPAHGGANQACLEMLKEIGTPDRIPEFIARAKDKNDPFRLMGFGHRVYKNFDPRAKVMKQLFLDNGFRLVYDNDLGEPRPINRRFQARGDFIEVINPAVFARAPLAMLEMFLVLQQHPELQGVRASTIRLARAHRHLIDERFRNDIRARALFIEIFREHNGLTHATRRMHRYGILARYLPAFHAVTGLMQFDLFHVYTVDTHTLFLVRNLRRFTVEKYRREFPLCSEVMEGIGQQELLMIAALFHDIAKGRGGDHSELGGRDAREFCERHDLSHYDSDLVSWLVEHHLLMSSVAQREDISDPVVVNRFANIVSNPVRLDYLYLLTVADIRGTNPEL